MNSIAYKFVTWDVTPLEDLKGMFVYQMKLKLLNGEKLTREEKDNIVAMSLFHNGNIKRGGWCFSFTPYMKTYLVKQYGGWIEYKAFDKTSLRKNIQGEIQKIVELF